MMATSKSQRMLVGFLWAMAITIFGIMVWGLVIALTQHNIFAAVIFAFVISVDIGAFFHFRGQA